MLKYFGVKFWQYFISDGGTKEFFPVTLQLYTLLSCPFLGTVAVSQRESSLGHLGPTNFCVAQDTAFLGKELVNEYFCSICSLVGVEIENSTDEDEYVLCFSTDSSASAVVPHD